MAFLELVNRDVKAALQMLAVICVVTVLSRLLMLWWKRRRLNDLAEKIPGPKPLPIVGNIFDLLGLTQCTTMKKFFQLSNRYENIFRVWIAHRLVIIVANPDDIEILLNSNKCFGRDQLAEIGKQYFFGESLFSLKGDAWKNHRKILVSGFSYSSLSQHVNVFLKNSKILLEILSKDLEKRVVDILPYLCKYSFDNICESVMGIKTNCQSNDSDEFLETSIKYFSMIFKFYTQPWLSVPLIAHLTGDHEKMCYYRDFMVEYCDRLVSSKLSKDETPNTHTLIDTMKMSKEDIRGHIIGMLNAGFETTASCVSFTLMLLSFHQEIQIRVHDELYKVFGNNIDFDNITSQHLSKLKYLEQVIQESLRLYPVVPLIPRKTEGEIQLKDYIIPSGCEVVFNLYALHRNSKYFPKPSVFNPDNFSTENCQKRHKYSFLPFSGGPRVCIGYKYAMLQMKTVLAMILHRFVVLPGTDPKAMNNVTYRVIIRLANGFKVKFVSKPCLQT